MYQIFTNKVPLDIMADNKWEAFLEHFCAAQGEDPMSGGCLAMRLAPSLAIEYCEVISIKAKLAMHMIRERAANAGAMSFGHARGKKWSMIWWTPPNFC